MHKAKRSIEEVPYYSSKSSIKWEGQTGGKYMVVILFVIITPRLPESKHIVGNNILRPSFVSTNQSFPSFKQIQNSTNLHRKI